MSYPSHCPTCRRLLTGLKRRYCGWGFATIDRCLHCGSWVLDDDGLERIEHDAAPSQPVTLPTKSHVQTSPLSTRDVSI